MRRGAPRAVALANLAKAHAANAAKRQAIFDAPAPDLTTEPLVPLGGEIVSSPDQESDEAVRANESRLVESGVSLAQQRRVTAKLIKVLEANLDAADPRVRTTAASELAAILGLKVSRQPAAQRAKALAPTHFRPGFALPKAVSARPVDDKA
jgi:hypothetical protein